MAESSKEDIVRTSSFHSSDEYSSEEDQGPKSLFNVHKRGHIPGKYKMDPQTPLAENTEQKSETTTVDDNAESQGDTGDVSQDEGETNNKRNSVSSILGSGIFGRSMVVVDNISLDSQDQEEVSVRKPKPPVAPKPKLAFVEHQQGAEKVPTNQDNEPSDKNSEQPHEVPQRPLPKPRKSKSSQSLPDASVGTDTDIQSEENVKYQLKTENIDEVNTITDETLTTCDNNDYSEGKEIEILTGEEFSVSDSLLPDIDPEQEIGNEGDDQTEEIDANIADAVEKIEKLGMSESPLPIRNIIDVSEDMLNSPDSFKSANEDDDEDDIFEDSLTSLAVDTEQIAVKIEPNVKPITEPSAETVDDGKDVRDESDIAGQSVLDTFGESIVVIHDRSMVDEHIGYTSMSSSVSSGEVPKSMSYHISSSSSFEVLSQSETTMPSSQNDDIEHEHDGEVETYVDKLGETSDDKGAFCNEETDVVVNENEKAISSEDTHEEFSEKSDETSINETDEKSKKESDETSIDKSDEKSIKESDEKSIKESDEKSIKESDEKSLKESEETSIDKNKEKSIEESVETSIDKSDEKSIKESEEKSIKESDEKSIKESDETSIDKSDEKSIKKSDEKSIKESDEKSIKESDEFWSTGSSSSSPRNLGKGSDESPQSGDLSVPPPVQPKSEVVMESLKFVLDQEDTKDKSEPPRTVQMDKSQSENCFTSAQSEIHLPPKSQSENNLEGSNIDPVRTERSDTTGKVGMQSDQTQPKGYLTTGGGYSQHPAYPYMTGAPPHGSPWHQPMGPYDNMGHMYPPYIGSPMHGNAGMPPTSMPYNPYYQYHMPQQQFVPPQQHMPYQNPMYMHQPSTMPVPSVTPAGMRTPERSDSPLQRSQRASSTESLKLDTSETKTPSSHPRPAVRQSKRRKTPEPVKEKHKEIKSHTKTTERTPVRPKPKARPAKIVEDPKEFCIQFKGISVDTSTETLSNVVEIATGIEVEPEKVEFNESRDCAWVVVQSKPELDKLRDRVKKKGINGEYPDVTEVPVSSLPSKQVTKPATKSKDITKPGMKSTPPKKKEEVFVKEEPSWSFIYFRGINPNTKEENLRNFVEIATKGSLTEIIYNYSRTCSLVSIDGDSKPDVKKLQTKVASNGLDGFKPDVVQVPLPTCIAVSSVGEIRSAESLGLYFETKHSNANADIVQGPDESEDGTVYVIEYENFEVVRRVCLKKDHKLDDVMLRVSPYYKCEIGAIWDAKVHTVVLPDPITIELDLLCVEFLQRKCCSDLLTMMEGKYCRVSFTNDSVILECLITPKVPKFKELASEWPTVSRNDFNKFVDDIVHEATVTSDDEVWSELIDFFQAGDITNQEDMVVSPCPTSYTIKLIGLKSCVVETCETLQSKHGEIKKRLNRRQETFKRKPLELKLLREINFFDNVKNDIEDLVVDFTDDSITVEAQPEDIKSVHVKLMEITNEIMKGQWKHGWSTYCVQFIQNKLMSRISKIFQDSGIKIALDIDDNYVEYYVLSEVKDADEIDSLVGKKIGDKVIEKTVICDANNTQIFESSEWEQFRETMTEKYEDTADFEVVIDKVIIYGLRTNVNELKKNVDDFVKDNSVFTKRIECKAIALRFIDKHMPNFLNDMEKKYSSQKMTFAKKGDYILTQATKEGLKMAEYDLEKFKKSFVTVPYTFDKVAVKEVMRDEYEQGTIDTIEKETRCIVQLPYEQQSQDDSDPEMVQSDEIREEIPIGEPKPKPRTPSVFTAKNGVSVTLVKGELHNQSGDVMVVTTAPDLNLSAGRASRTILKAAGQELQDECKQKYPENIKFGEIAVVHGYGSLECKYVYLTTLPNWSKHEDPTQVLRKIMKDSLELASKHNKHSIMFTAMGTGQLHYPIDTVAMVMFECVVQFDAENPSTKLKEVKFVLYQKDYPTIKGFEEEIKRRISGDIERPKYELQRGNIKIEVVIEDISRQKVDAIFCTTSTNMDLNHGACKALLKAGGNGLKQECETKYSNQLDDGQVVEINGGNLQCKWVFLTVLPRYNDNSLKDLEKVMNTMLGLCESKNVASVAMPALGTGNLKYPKQEVCETMFNTINTWAQTKTNTSLRNIRLIMHVKDQEVIKVFQNYISSSKTRGRRGDRDSITASRSMTGAVGGPQPQKSRFHAHDDKISIGKVDVKVILGDLLKQKTNVIVNSVGKDFELIGAVAQSLSKTCPDIVAESKRPDKIKQLHDKHIVKTPTKDMPASYVFHLQHTDRLDEWTSRIKLCLQKANKHKFRSISFPVLGTGQGYTSFSPEDISGCMFDAINDFEIATDTVYVRNVQIVVFYRTPQMKDLIVKTLHNKVKEGVNKPPKESKFGKLFKKGKQWWNNWFEMKPEERTQIRTETSSMTVDISSDHKDNIDKCITELKSKIEQRYSKKKIDNYVDVIKSLDQSELDQLDVPSLVNTNIDSASGIITVEGPSKQVDEAINDINMKLLRIERNRNEAKHAEELYKIVQWHYEETLDTGELKITAYHKELNLKIEEAYKGNKPDLSFEANGKTYVIDFKMLEEYDRDDDLDRIRVIRKDILKEATGALPADWTPMKNDTNLLVVDVDPTDPSYKRIEQKFLNEVKTGGYCDRVKFSFNPSNVKVSKIQRVQNKTLYQQYQAKKKKISEQKPNLPANMPIERELWHGMKPEVIASIQNHGFNRSYSGVANGEPWYGQGVYFAGDASYSCRNWLTGAKPGTKSHVFLVNVLTGQFCQGAKGMRYLPVVDQAKPLILYDSAVDDPAKPYEFVIFNDTQAYPAYLVTFSS